MPILVKDMPQKVMPIRWLTLQGLVDVLPEKLDYPVHVWIGGKFAVYARTADNLIFYLEGDGDPTSEVMQYFNSLVEPLGIQATASHAWRYNKYSMIRIYNFGNLIKTGLPDPTLKIPVLTASEVKSKLPKTVPWIVDIYATGGVVANGESCNDFDLIIGKLNILDNGDFEFEEQPKQVYADMKNYFTKLFGWKTDVGSRIMKEREVDGHQIPLFKLYEGGKLCL